MIDARHQQNRTRRGAGDFASQDLARRGGPRVVREQGETERVAVTLAGQMEQESAGAVVPFPPILGAATAETAPQDGVVEREPGQDLRHLGDVPERIRHVARAHHRAERLRDAMAESQISHQGLAADQEHVGHHVPGPDQKPALDDAAAQRSLPGPAGSRDSPEHDGLTVEMEVRELLLAVHPVENAIDEIDETQSILLAGQVPLAVPVGVGDDMDLDRGWFGQGSILSPRPRSGRRRRNAGAERRRAARARGR